MAIIKEPKGIDFVVKSQPWSDEELKEFRKIMAKQKSDLDVKNKKIINERIKDSNSHPV